ncbi:MAG: HNH endonuclease signature motif containing protein, partial [Trebonia sp.]
RNRDRPDTRQAAALTELLRALNPTFTPIAKGSCDHASREHRYTPSRTLKDLIRARTARCTAPGCGAHAVHCDLDHTLPYPAGITCQCDLAPACRRHHRCKQAPGWQLTQPQPGIMHWTTPTGRSHTTRPTIYEM